MLLAAGWAGWRVKRLRGVPVRFNIEGHLIFSSTLHSVISIIAPP
jgi:hypothetical protein